MKTIMARNPHDSLSFSRRYFNFKKKPIDDEDDGMESILTFDSTKSEDHHHRLDSSTSSNFNQAKLKRSHSTNSSSPLALVPNPNNNNPVTTRMRSSQPSGNKTTKTKPSSFSTLPFIISKLLKSSLNISTLTKPSSNRTKKALIGTIFGHRRGHVNLAFQEDFNKRTPLFMVQLATPTSVLVKDMACGLVRIALECDKKFEIKRGHGFKLLEEPIWRAYCNGKKCGYGMRREFGVEELKVLNSIGKISFGAGVLPGSGRVGGDGDGSKEVEEEGEVMYMRAKFERVVGNRDSEAFYMVSPDYHHHAGHHGGGGGGGPELSIYLLRV